jgi:hypothetical protein
MIDDLSAPLGQQQKKPRWARALTAFCVVGSLILFLGLWATGGDNRLGAWWHPVKVTNMPEAAGSAERTSIAPKITQEPIAPVMPAKTITIINGQTGAREEIAISPAPTSDVDLLRH